MAAIVVTFTYMFIFFKKLKITDHKCFAMFFFKVLLASIIMMFVLAIMKNSIETYMYTDFIAEVATTVGLTVVGVVIYYVELMLLRVKEITWILSKQS